MRIVMMGTGTFAEPTFQTLIEAFPGEVVGLVTQPEREVGRRSGSSRQTGLGMATIAKAANIPVIQPASINSDEGLALLSALNPDLLVVAAYGQILKPTVLAIPKLGAINVHASLLPKYRGAAPVAHAILNGETETGVTIIRITPGLDAGEMLAKEATAIGSTETTGELEARLAIIGAKLAVEIVEKLKRGQMTAEKQDETAVSKASKIKKEHGLIDWTKSATTIANHVRAMQPWPTAYTYLHRPGMETIRVIISRVSDPVSHDGHPGEITILIARVQDQKTIKIESKQFICVGTSNRSAIWITELQPAGKKVMSAAEFLRGHPLPEGSRFGPETL